MPWESIKYVSGWFTLIAFVTLAVVSLLRYRIKQQSVLLNTIPDTDKSRAVDKILGRFDVSAGNLTKEQQYNLAITQINNTQNRYKGWQLIVGIVAILILLIWGISLFLVKSEEKIATPLPLPSPTPTPPLSPTDKPVTTQSPSTRVKGAVAKPQSRINQSMNKSPGGIQAGGDVIIGGDQKQKNP
jgi:uncharacterized membrane protein